MAYSSRPGDYSTTPGCTLFSTTPAGTRIIYDRKFLMGVSELTCGQNTSQRTCQPFLGSLALPAMSLPSKPVRATCPAAQKISRQAVKSHSLRWAFKGPAIGRNDASGAPRALGGELHSSQASFQADTGCGSATQSYSSLRVPVLPSIL